MRRAPPCTHITDATTMLATHRDSTQNGPVIDQLLAADLHGDLVSARQDLDRLQTLLAGACEELAASFFGANEHIDELRHGGHNDAVQQLAQHLWHAITALQFQDMASQLIAHTHSRLRDCTDRLAVDGQELAPDAQATTRRANPVAQQEMDPGSVELF